MMKTDLAQQVDPECVEVKPLSPAEPRGAAKAVISDSGPIGGGRTGGVNLGTAAIVGLALLVATGLGLAVRSLLRSPSAPGVTADATPETMDAILNAVAAYLKEDELGKAEAIVQEAIGKYVEEQRLYNLYGEVLVAGGRHEEAYEQYVKALAIGPRTAELEFTAGTVANMANRLDRAIEHYGAAQVQAPTDARIPLYLAQVLIKQNAFDEAQKNLLIAGKLDPDVATVWGTLAEILLRQNKPDLAITTVRRARAIEPDKVTWRLIEARAIKRENRPQEALQLLIGLNDAQRMEAGVLPLMAECFGMLSRPGDAGEVYARASDSSTEQADLAMQAASWLEKARNFDGAKRYAERAARLGAPGAEELLARLAK